MKEYTVKEFVEGYENSQDDNSVWKFISENIIIVNDYINFISKVNLCDLLVDTTCKDKAGNIRFDSVTRDMLYKLNLINLYTNINIEFGNTDNPLYNQYDLLQKHGFLSYMIDAIPKTELDEFDQILASKLSDFKNNNHTTSACINKHVERIRDLGVSLINPLIEELDKKLPEILNSLNKKDIEKIVKRVAK